MSKRWYVISTYAGYENKVKANLERRIKSMNVGDKIFQILVPTEEITELKSGKKKIVSKKFFPGYLLVQMDLTDESWYVVRNTPRVSGFIGTGIKPIPISDEEVEKIVGQMQGTIPRPKLTLQFEKGEQVKIIDGPFSNFSGIIEEVNMERSKIKVMVTIFGRPTPVELDFLQIEKI
ncbi:MAG: transcription termination/antitermination protein NusG [Candidatus Firestonebacteria bacterium]